MCILVWLTGFQKTNLTTWLWVKVAALNVVTSTYAKLALTVLVITAFAYILGPVISVILLLDIANPCENQLEFILLLAWCCGLAGNLTPSANIAPLMTTSASMHVLERRAMYWRHLIFSLPTGIFILVLGVVVIHCLSVVL